MRFFALALLLMSPSAYAAVCQQWSEPKIAGTLDSTFLREASGVVVSKQFPNRVYHMVDGDQEARVTMTEANGKLIKHIPIKELHIKADTEDLAYGPCESAKCIFIANIGDNNTVRESVEVLSFKEEKDYPGPAKILSHLTLRYPQGPVNAEAMIVHPNGDLYIFTKEKPHKKTVPATQIFKLSKDQLRQTHGEFTLEAVGVLDLKKFLPQAKKKDLVVTGAAASEDGKRFLLVTQGVAVEFEWDFSGPIKASSPTVKLLALAQPEAIDYLPGSKSFIVTSEAQKASSSSILQIDCLK